MTAAKRTWIAMTIAAALTLTACAGSDTGLPATDKPVLVTAVDYGFEGLPERVAAGTTLALTNESSVEVHELVAIRLPDTEERSVEELVQLPPAELAAFFPMVETVVIAPPGEEGIAVEGTGALSEPGRYAVICAIPTGANPDEYLAAAADSAGGPPQVAGGPPHLAMGMYAEIVVVES
jgi:plastocyanin